MYGEKLDSNYTRMLSWQYWTSPEKQHPTKQAVRTTYHLSWNIIQVRQTRHADHCWRSKDELISDVFLWTPSHGWAKAGWPARTYIQQLCADTGYSLEDHPGAMDKWWERVREILAGGVTCWRWCDGGVDLTVQ